MPSREGISAWGSKGLTLEIVFRFGDPKGVDLVSHGPGDSESQSVRSDTIDDLLFA